MKWILIILLFVGCSKQITPVVSNVHSGINSVNLPLYFDRSSIYNTNYVPLWNWDSSGIKLTPQYSKWIDANNAHRDTMVITPIKQHK